MPEGIRTELSLHDSHSRAVEDPKAAASNVSLSADGIKVATPEESGTVMQCRIGSAKSLGHASHRSSASDPFTAPALLNVARLTVDDLPPELQRKWLAYSVQGFMTTEGVGALLHDLGSPVTGEEASQLATLLGSAEGKVDLEGFLALCGGLDEDGGDGPQPTKVQKLRTRPTLVRRRASMKSMATREQRRREKQHEQRDRAHVVMRTCALLLIAYELFEVPLRIFGGGQRGPAIQIVDYTIDALIPTLLVGSAVVRATLVFSSRRRSSLSRLPMWIMRCPMWSWHPLGVLYQMTLHLSPRSALDFLAWLPLEVILCHWAGFGGDCGNAMFRLNRLVFLHRLGDCFSTVTHLISLATGLRENSSILGITLLWLYLVHLTASVFLGVAKLEGDDATRHVSYFPDFSKASFSQQYLQALDWSTKTTTGLSRGMPVPATDLQHVFGFCTMLAGVVVYAGFIATVAATLQAPTTYSRFRDKLEQTSCVLRYRGLPPQFRDECLNYYRHMFRTTGAFSDEVGSLFSDLPTDLARQINIALGESMLRKVNMFRGVTDRDFFADLVRMLHPRVVVPDTMVFREGTCGREMFFVTHGRFEVIVQGRVVAQLETGSVFGEIAVLLNVRRTATVVAAAYSTVLTLSAKDFDTVSASWPEVRHEIDLAAQPAIEAALQQEEERMQGDDRALADSMSLSSTGTTHSESIRDGGLGLDTRRAHSSMRKARSFIRGQGSGDDLGGSGRLSRSGRTLSRSLGSRSQKSVSFLSVDREGGWIDLGGADHSHSQVHKLSIDSADSDLAAIGIDGRRRQASISSMGSSNGGKKTKARLRLRDAIRASTGAAAMRRAAQEARAKLHRSRQGSTPTSPRSRTRSSVSTASSFSESGTSLSDRLRTAFEKLGPDEAGGGGGSSINVATLLRRIRSKSCMMDGEDSAHERSADNEKSADSPQRLVDGCDDSEHRSIPSCTSSYHGQHIVLEGGSLSVPQVILSPPAMNQPSEDPLPVSRVGSAHLLDTGQR
eukprot:TRINITY_DN9547_c0_g1_i2.p1 TRINITY_DN9547_c0_g1~~TRINITY_DN9547_c0_g1_i2.p1  ORF type:complete len:1169 (+),score=265.12 TRINITY_DN9547_c0_g1_i2:481-3507(+)